MRVKKIIPIVSASLLLITAFFIVLTIEPEAAKKEETAIIHQPVTVVKVNPEPYRPTIELLGTTQPRWLTEIKAQTEGKVTWLDPNFEPGTLVSKGETLLKLETTHLESQVAEAKSLLKQAELDLQREKHEQTVAIKMLSKTSSSAYARREPQIAAAKAHLNQARKAYESALRHLHEATIVAPFDAIILNRHINPEQFIENGQALFLLAASDSLDVKVPVPELKWTAMTAVLAKPEIKIVDKQHRIWPASVRYIAPQADSDTRQRQVVLSVEKPYQNQPHLLPHQQVRVNIMMQSHPTVSSIPASALTRDGQVWTVNQQNQLTLESVLILEEKNQQAWVTFNDSQEQTHNVVMYPLLSMIQGQQVSPEEYDEKQMRAGL